MANENERKLMTRAEVAAFLRLDVRTVSALALPAIRLGRQYRYDQADVLKLFDNKTVASTGGTATEANHEQK